MSTKVIHSPQVLILASRYDFSCDYVVESLRAIGTSYFRLNSEDLPGFELVLDPIRATLRGKSEEIDFSIIAEDLQSVYYPKKSSWNLIPPLASACRAPAEP